jgi:hypothetical protein
MKGIIFLHVPSTTEYDIMGYDSGLADGEEMIYCLLGNYRNAFNTFHNFSLSFLTM